jgi:hypothetical protein
MTSPYMPLSRTAQQDTNYSDSDNGFIRGRIENCHGRLGDTRTERVRSTFLIHIELVSCLSRPAAGRRDAIDNPTLSLALAHIAAESVGQETLSRQRQDPSLAHLGPLQIARSPPHVRTFRVGRQGYQWR